MNIYLRSAAKFFLHCGLLAIPAVAVAQSPLDIGGHLTPQMRYITSSSAEMRPSNMPTAGDDGLAVSIGGGGYLEYEFAPGWSARAGIDLSYKRNHYTVKRTFAETGEVAQGHNRISYASIEVPVSLIYHFDYQRHDTRYLVGVGTTVNRWNGAPVYQTSFFRKGSVAEPVSVAKHTLTIFGGYERPLSDAFVMSYEPYIAYVPSEFRLETSSRSRILLETGISVRVRLDN
ncbi:hypothetical protein [Lewinella sp. IMCC34191]|uniref:hypothetical protein n=1 Tax=Lewinella sp. IMCC34191 TaxID=2259172 RepID=UPI000E266C39|nr:hypothetical protein [Lewinella sp. IMCC34191]